jgi:hypothetical protein
MAVRLNRQMIPSQLPDSNPGSMVTAISIVTPPPFFQGMCLNAAGSSGDI